MGPPPAHRRRVDVLLRWRQRALSAVPPLPESTALAKGLKRNGFRFFGPTTAYALKQACGLVNDHLAGCFVRDEVARDQASVPLGACAGESSTMGGLR